MAKGTPPPTLPVSASAVLLPNSYDNGDLGAGQDLLNAILAGAAASVVGGNVLSRFQ